MKLALGLALVAGAAFIVAAQPTRRGCDGDPRVAAAAAAWRTRSAQPPLALPLSEATCFRDALLRRLGLGPVIGYKVGVYTAAARKTYRSADPAVGVLHRAMIAPSGKPISARLGFAPLAEADLLLVVRDAAINRAQTRAEIYANLRGWRPFIELPDNHYPADTPPDLARLTALDVGARAGVMGAEVPLPKGDHADTLADFAVEATITTAEGAKTSRARIGDTLGDPIEIVRAARDLLRREGKMLRAGDVISLGTIVPAHPPIAGERFRVGYALAGRTGSVEARFTD